MLVGLHRLCRCRGGAGVCVSLSSACVRVCWNYKNSASVAVGVASGGLLVCVGCVIRVSLTDMRTVENAYFWWVYLPAGVLQGLYKNTKKGRFYSLRGLPEGESSLSIR